MATKKRPRKTTTDAEETLDRMAGRDPLLREQVEEAKLDMHVAQMILEAREAEGLSQAQLARLVGTQQSVISRLEDADYQGRSLTMLQRIAAALHRKLDVRLLPEGSIRGSTR